MYSYKTKSINNHIDGLQFTKRYYEDDYGINKVENLKIRNVIVVIEYRNELIKVQSKRYKTVINISDKVISNMSMYVQNRSFINESGGVLLGYKVKEHNVIIIDDLSLPDKEDESSMIKFIRKSISHILKINKSSLNNSFCIGNWHTHPVSNPTPSLIDLSTWKKNYLSVKVLLGFKCILSAV